MQYNMGAICIRHLIYTVTFEFCTVNPENFMQTVSNVVFFINDVLDKNESLCEVKAMFETNSK